MGKVKENPEKIIGVCTGSKCRKYNKEILASLKQFRKDKGNKEKIEVVKTLCLDRCKQAPVVFFQPENRWLTKVQAEEIKRSLEVFTK
ncbi:MAG: ferredoxin [Thermonemataceae bacterium]